MRTEPRRPLPARPHLLLLACAGLGLAGACEPTSRPPEPTHEHPAAGQPTTVPPPSELNPVQREMRLLETAMHRSLSLIANGELSELPPTVFAIHAARSETERALADGSYVPPVNGGDIAGFTAQDAAFHGLLVDMVRAAKADDRRATAAAYAEVIQGCTTCHATYRAGY